MEPLKIEKNLPEFENRATTLYRYINTLMEELVVSHQEFIKTDAAELSLQERKAISYLGARGNPTMSEMANHLHVAVSTMTGIVDKLVKKKLVARRRSKTDRRIVELKITPEGERNYQEEREKFKQWSRDMLSRIDETDQETILAIMEKIVKNTG